MAESYQGYQSLSHSKWDCKYHVVFIPKKTRKVLFGQARRYVGEIFHVLAWQKECQIVESHLMPDHVHMCIAIPPKYAVASVIGFLKGKGAIAITRQLCGKECNFTGEHLLEVGTLVLKQLIASVSSVPFVSSVWSVWSIWAVGGNWGSDLDI